MTAARYTPAEMRNGADWCELKADSYDQWQKTFEAAELRSIAKGLRQAASDAEALEQAQRERDAAEESARNMQARLQRVVDGPVKMQRKVKELRRQVQIDADCGLKCNAIRWMDLLGLTGDDATSPSPEIPS